MIVYVVIYVGIMSVVSWLPLSLSLQDAAVASLKSLNKSDVVEVRALQRPPIGVKLVIEAVCIMKEVKPKKVSCIYSSSPLEEYNCTIYTEREGL